jgi:hypothetical protein
MVVPALRTMTECRGHGISYILKLALFGAESPALRQCEKI